MPRKTKTRNRPARETLASGNCSATVNWFCPECRQWFKTLLMQNETRIHAKIRCRRDHIDNGCSAKPNPEYATATIGEYTVPLIGVPKAATQEKCSKCGAVIHLKDSSVDENFNPVCKACAPNDRTERSADNAGRSQPKESNGP